LEQDKPGSLRSRPAVQFANASAFLLLLVVGLTAARTALAQRSDAPTGATPAETNQPTPGQTSATTRSTASAPAGLWERANLFGDMGGVRTFLGRYGVSLGLTETSEVLGNPTGGRAQGATYEELTEASLGVDLGKAIGLDGGIFNVSALQIHGRGLSTNNIDNLNVVSSIEADRSTRLFELWYQQSFLGGKVDLKVGQQGADFEFMVTQYGGMFINSSFGWPTLAAVDLPSGGPAYPLATPGARLRVQPTDAVAALLGVFNGNPAGNGTGDPQRRNASGTNFNLDSGVFVISEVQYSINPGDNATGLPGTYKLGSWYNSNAFTNQFLANASINAAALFANLPGIRRNDWSVYAVMDQLVFRPAGSKTAGAGIFTRVTGTPGDRNEVNVFVDGGITYKGDFGRDNDTMAFGFAWTRISDTARAGDAALAAYSGNFYPIRSSESLLELTYQAQVAAWWIVQPDFQYIFNPGAGIVNPKQPTKRIGDAAILLLRTSITF
jgi:porin